MTKTPLEIRKIKRDILEVYHRTEIHFLYATIHTKEFAHLLRAYDLTEKELKQILWEIKNPNEIYPEA